MEKLARFNKIANKPANKRLYCITIGIASIAFILSFAMVIWFNDIPSKGVLFMRGCVGLCAIITVIFAGIFFYRVFSEYHKQPVKLRKTNIH